MFYWTFRRSIYFFYIVAVSIQCLRAPFHLDLAVKDMKLMKLKDCYKFLNNEPDKNPTNVESHRPIKKLNEFSKRTN